jgi:hypothetical protein
MTVLKTAHLTADPVDDAAIESFPGMAFFAGTGPQWTECRHCNHWDREPIEPGAKVKPIKSSTCAMFRRLTGETGKKVPAEASACKYFQPAEMNHD